MLIICEVKTQCYNCTCKAEILPQSYQDFKAAEMLTLPQQSLELLFPLLSHILARNKPLRSQNRFNKNSFFPTRVHTERFSTVKEILNTNIMVCHHSVTAASNNALWHPAEWIVHSGSDPWPNLQITSNFQSEVCAFLPAICGTLRHLMSAFY